MEQMEIQHIPFSQVKPYWRNPRKNEAAIRAVTESITKYGFNVPLGIDTENTIITGHTRYLAAQKLKLKTLPCIILTHLTPAQVKEYRIADNASAALSEWDEIALIAEMKEFTDIGSFNDIFFNGDPIVKAFDKPFFDETQFERDTSPEDIEQAETKINTNFSSNVEAKQDDQVSISCPHCGEIFFVAIAEMKADIKSRNYQNSD